MFDQKTIDRYIKLLRLQDWKIDCVEIPTLLNDAQTKLVYEDYAAIIEMRAELSNEVKELTLIHELLHLIYRDAYDIFSEQCKNEELKLYCERQHERAIEKTAKIIYSLTREAL